MELYQPEEVIVERGSVASSIYRNLSNALPQIPFRIVDTVSLEHIGGNGSRLSFGAAKKKLFLTRHRGEFLKKCPGSAGQVCCNYFVINFASNCPMDCSYCYLQEYLADNPALKVFSNLDDLLTEADVLLS
ncbi:MAG TPA: radical SAM protein, partial [Candidatus Binatia bacterium]|nr:radical SAM protein [Candidatus Binatia bacterium]